MSKFQKSKRSSVDLWESLQVYKTKNSWARRTRSSGAGCQRSVNCALDSPVETRHLLIPEDRYSVFFVVAVGRQR